MFPWISASTAGLSNTTDNAQPAQHDRIITQLPRNKFVCHSAAQHTDLGFSYAYGRLLLSLVALCDSRRNQVAGLFCCGRLPAAVLAGDLVGCLPAR